MMALASAQPRQRRPTPADQPEEKRRHVMPTPVANSPKPEIPTRQPGRPKPKEPERKRARYSGKSIPKPGDEDYYDIDKATKLPPWTKLDAELHPQYARDSFYYHGERTGKLVGVWAHNMKQYMGLEFKDGVEMVPQEEFKHLWDADNASPSVG